MIGIIRLPIPPQGASSPRTRRLYVGFMRSHRLALLVATWAALATARAHPAPEPDTVPRLDLEQVLGRTLCPLTVLVDEDPLRLPRRIKFMACERSQEKLCPARGAAASCCRRGDPRGERTRCVEVYDRVVVQYLPAVDAPASNATQALIQVPVGCACVVHSPVLAIHDSQ